LCWSGGGEGGRGFGFGFLGSWGCGEGAESVAGGWGVMVGLAGQGRLVVEGLEGAEEGRMGRRGEEGGAEAGGHAWVVSWWGGGVGGWKDGALGFALVGMVGGLGYWRRFFDYGGVTPYS